ncbi:PD-(D/E)XK nuclease family protein [Porphyromonas sp.]
MEEDSKTLTQEEVNSLLGLAKSYNEEREKELGKLPFRYNVLEEVRVNENAHTRLLMRLLQYDPARKDFFKYLEGKGFAPLTMSKPKITVEKYRIDGLIQKEGEYAVIVENKVCGAVDQEGQLGRYIEQCRRLKYTDDQIYILYLVDRPGKEPSEQTLKDYKEEFEGRTLVLSYAEDIIPWVQKFLDALESDKQEKEKLLRSGVTQYLDYLKMTFMNSHQINMEEWLKVYIAEKEKVELKNLSDSQIKKVLMPEFKTLTDLTLTARRLLGTPCVRDCRVDITRRWGEECLFVDEKTDYFRVGIYYQLNNISFLALIELKVETGNVCVGFGCHHEGEGNLNPTLQKTIKETLTNASYKEPDKRYVNNYWYWWEEVEPDEAMTKFNELVAVLKELGATPVPAEKAEE